MASSINNLTNKSKKKKKKKHKHLFDSIVTTKQKIDSCEAMLETCSTFEIELQNQILEINNRLAKCEAIKINSDNTLATNEIESTFGKAIYDFGNAIKKHNNTIKTHLNLRESYNSAVMKNIENEMFEIARLNKVSGHRVSVDGRERSDDSVKQGSTIINKEKNRRIIACEIGKISIRPLESKKSICNQIRVHIYDSKCSSLNEARTFLSNLFTSFNNSIDANNVKWWTTKMTFDQQKQNEFKRINFIACLPEQIDTVNLTTHMERVFAEFGS